MEQSLSWNANESCTIQNSENKNIHAPAGFEHAVPASQQPHTNTLDRMATESGTYNDMAFVMNLSFCQSILTEICR